MSDEHNPVSSVDLFPGWGAGEFKRPTAEQMAAAAEADDDVQTVVVDDEDVPDYAKDDIQPRDDKGRFIGKDESKIPANDDQDVTIEIDLGEGSGKQVFKASNYEELSKKLAKAQEHASRKIRELSKNIKHEEPKKLEPKTLTSDEEFLLGQEMTTEPSKAIDKILAAELGMSISELREEIKASRETREWRRQLEVGVQMVGKYPELQTNAALQNAVEKFVEEHKLQRTFENLEYALLQVEGSVETSQVSKVEAKETPRIEATPKQKPKKASTGLSARNSSRESSADAGLPSAPTAEELARLPMPEARQRIAEYYHALKMANSK